MTKTVAENGSPVNKGMPEEANNCITCCVCTYVGLICTGIGSKLKYVCMTQKSDYLLALKMLGAVTWVERLHS